MQRVAPPSKELDAALVRGKKRCLGKMTGEPRRASARPNQGLEQHRRALHEQSSDESWPNGCHAGPDAGERRG